MAHVKKGSPHAVEHRMIVLEMLVITSPITRNTAARARCPGVMIVPPVRTLACSKIRLENSGATTPVTLAMAKAE
jgi:hypothetical protein